MRSRCPVNHRDVCVQMDASPITRDTKSKLEDLLDMKKSGLLDTGEFKSEKKRVFDHQDEMRRIRRLKLVSVELSVSIC